MGHIRINDVALVKFDNYNDYLDMFITKMDLCYFRNLRSCRNLIKLNYRPNNNVYTREVFEERRSYMSDPAIQAPIIYSHGRHLDDPVLISIASREKPNRQKILSTIVYICTRSSSGFELSSYFDLEQSFRCHDQKWNAIFEKRAKLCPHKSHLSFYDSRINTIRYNDSDNYTIINDTENGLTFMHKGDHKKLHVLSRRTRRKNFTRQIIYSPVFGYVKFFDHTVRKKV